MTLADRDVRLLRLSVAVCQGDWDALRAVRRAAPAGEPDRGWREAILQSHLFAGFPRVVEACSLLEAEGGLGSLDPGEDAPLPDRPDVGRELFDRIYAAQSEPVRASLTSFHPVLAQWIEGHAYGRVLTRDGLPPSTREVLAVGCLAAQDQERQLASHVRGAMRLGVSAADLDAALTAIGDLLGNERLHHTRRLVAALAQV